MTPTAVRRPTDFSRANQASVISRKNSGDDA